MTKLKTVRELECLPFNDRIEYINSLSTEDRNTLKSLVTREVNKRKKKFQELKNYDTEFRKNNNVDSYYLESIKSEISHLYKIKDIVVLKDNYDIVEIAATKGTKQYKINNYQGFKSAYTQDTINEDDILCKAIRFNVNNILKENNK